MRGSEERSYGTYLEEAQAQGAQALIARLAPQMQVQPVPMVGCWGVLVQDATLGAAYDRVLWNPTQILDYCIEQLHLEG